MARRVANTLLFHPMPLRKHSPFLIQFVPVLRHVMAEVLVQFDEPYRAPNGRAFVAQVCGQPLGNGRWEGWIQYMPTDGGDPVRTRRETEQFSRGDLRYWAAGLTRAQLQETLSRALNERQKNAPWQMPMPLAFDDIDPEERIIFDSATVSNVAAIIDPFVLYAQGVHVLHEQLRLLDAAQLKAIIAEYNIPESEAATSARTFEESLVQRIVAEVQHRVESGQRSVQKGTPVAPK
jgi:hypothetical protein